MSVAYFRTPAFRHVHRAFYAKNSSSPFVISRALFDIDITYQHPARREPNSIQNNFAVTFNHHPVAISFTFEYTMVFL